MANYACISAVFARTVPSLNSNSNSWNRHFQRKIQFRGTHAIAIPGYLDYFTVIVFKSSRNVVSYAGASCYCLLLLLTC